MVSIYKMIKKETSVHGSVPINEDDIRWMMSVNRNALIQSAFSTIELSLFSGTIDIKPHLQTYDSKLEQYLVLIGKSILRSLLTYGFCLIVDDKKNPLTVTLPSDYRLCFVPHKGQTPRKYYFSNNNREFTNDMFMLAVSEPFDDGHPNSKLLGLRSRIESLRLMDNFAVMTAVRLATPILYMNTKDSKNQLGDNVREVRQRDFAQQQVERKKKEQSQERDAEFNRYRQAYEIEHAALTASFVTSSSDPTDTDPRFTALALQTMRASSLNPVFQIPAHLELTDGPHPVIDNVLLAHLRDNFESEVARTFMIPSHFFVSKYMTDSVNDTMREQWSTAIQFYSSMVSRSLEFVVYQTHRFKESIKEEPEEGMMGELLGTETEEVDEVFVMEETKYTVFISQRPALSHIQILMDMDVLTPQATAQLLATNTGLPIDNFRVEDDKPKRKKKESDLEEEKKTKKKKKNLLANNNKT